MKTFWAYGFRSFFLIGSFVSFLLIAYWSLSFYNERLPLGYLAPNIWHAHEMIYGFTMSIVAGFLLTASASWTQSKPVSGTKLMLVFCCWILGRVAMVMPLIYTSLSPWPFLIIDLLFIPALIYVLSPHIMAAKMWRNIQFLFVLGILWIGNLMIHLGSMGVIEDIYVGRGIYLGVNLILLIVIIVGGRIVPAFTRNAIAQANIETHVWLERLSYLSVVLFIISDFFDWPKATGFFALVASGFHFALLLGWDSIKTLKNPLLLILHLGYFWVPVGFFIIFISAFFDVIPKSVAIHTFTAGAMGTFIIGMMSRVSLGHTGRPLKLPKGFTIAYVLITLSAIVRVASGLMPEFYKEGILIAGAFWVSSFIVFIYYYFTILTSPRADGKPG